MKTLDIQALTWFDKVNGNSYFSALITVDFGTENEKEIKLPFQYGYGNQFEYESVKALKENGFLPEKLNDHLQSYCKDNNIILRLSNRKNCLKRDLKNLVN
jgi:hypothetical protein